MDPVSGQTKVCAKCGEEKATSEFHTRVKRGKTVLRPRCIVCERADTKIANQARYVPHPKPKVTEKACTGCGRTFPIEEFPIHTQATGKRRAQCTECTRATAKARREATPDHARQLGRATYHRHREQYLEAQRRFAQEHPDKVRAKQDRYRAAHPDAIKRHSDAYRARNMERLRERQRQYRLQFTDKSRASVARWKRAHKAVVNAIYHRHRAAMKANGGSYTAAEWEALKAEFNYTCLLCERREPEIALTVDHIQPISKGGLNIIDNIQPLCGVCNSTKHTQTLDLRVVWYLNHPREE